MTGLYRTRGMSLLLLPWERGEEGEEHLIAFEVEGAFFVRHFFDFISEAESEHVFGFGFVDVVFGEDRFVGRFDEGSFGRSELLFDGREESEDFRIVHDVVSSLGSVGCR